MQRLRTSSAPGTIFLLIAIALGFLMSWATQSSFGISQLMFSTATVSTQPWSVFTYPLARGSGDFTGLLFLILSMMWLWQFGAMVERDMRTGPYLITFFTFTLLGAGAAALAGILTGGATLFSAFLPTAAITLIWCARNPSATINMWGIPLNAKQLALLDGALTVLAIGMGNAPLVGLFCGIPLALAWFWANDRLPIPYPKGTTIQDGGRRSASEAKRERAKFNEYIDDVRERERKRTEQERLRRMFEDSISKDD